MAAVLADSRPYMCLMLARVPRGRAGLNPIPLILDDIEKGPPGRLNVRVDLTHPKRVRHEVATESGAANPELLKEAAGVCRNRLGLAAGHRALRRFEAQLR